MKKALVILMAAVFVSLVSVNCEAAQKNYELVEATYTVKAGDTLHGIAETYMAKNNYGPREIREFTSGIKELNDWLLHRDIQAGDVLRINYWIKK